MFEDIVHMVVGQNAAEQYMSSLAIFIIILVGGFLFGISGMIIAIPMYTAIKVIGKVFYSENKFIKKLTKNL